GWPCDNSGGDPAASDAMILPSRSVQASPSASILMPGFFASKRRAMSLNALVVCGSVFVCPTRPSLSRAPAGAGGTAPRAGAGARHRRGCLGFPPVTAVIGLNGGRAARRLHLASAPRAARLAATVDRG